MAEAIIARRSKYENGSSGPDVPITPGYSSVLVTVYDSANSVVPFVAINCKDGSFWYNTHTNAQGQALITCNSGSLDVLAHNWSSQNAFKILDQAEASNNNVNAPINQAVYCNVQYTNHFTTTTYRSTGAISSSGSLYSGNCSFRVAKHVNLAIGAGGGGGYWTYEDDGTGAGAGGGGAYAEYNNVTVSNTQYYKFYIGSGGWGNERAHGAGGSTSALGYVVNGGSMGSGTRGGAGGTGMYAGGNGGNGGTTRVRAESGKAGGSTKWGGGGGGGYSTVDGQAYTGSGVYGGGSGGGYKGNGRDGVNGGGGGGAGECGYRGNGTQGGDGGGGMIQMTIYA